MAKTNNRRAVPPAREQVALTAPAGFTVLVSPNRARVLQGRGYTLNTTAKDAPRVDRASLIERAKAVGVPAKGTNEALLEAVVAAEADATTSTATSED